MIITPEQAALKARDQFDTLRDFVQRVARDGQWIDTVEVVGVVLGLLPAKEPAELPVQLDQLFGGARTPWRVMEAPSRHEVLRPRVAGPCVLNPPYIDAIRDEAELLRL